VWARPPFTLPPPQPRIRPQPVKVFPGRWGGFKGWYWSGRVLNPTVLVPSSPVPLRWLVASGDNQKGLWMQAAARVELVGSWNQQILLPAEATMNNQAPEQTLRLIRNQDLTLRFRMQPPQDVTGWNITWKVQIALGGTTQIIKSVGSGITLTYPGKGVLDVSLAAADTSALTVTTGLATGQGYVWELSRTDAGNRLVLARGNLILEQEIV
jgi:hypothetical protein